jgi:hypothetical protein
MRRHHRAAPARWLPLAPMLAAATAACFPAVTHGPRVEPGLAAGLTGAYTVGPTHVEGDEGGIRLRSGVVGAYGGYGWAPASARAPRLHVAIAVPILFPLAQVDAFVQAPPAWTGPLSAGAGIVASSEGVHAYGQAGRVSARGMGWYLTGGYGRRESWSTVESSSPAWFGAAAVQLAAGHARTHLFVQGADGRIPGRCPFGQGGRCERGERARALAVGATLGWARRRAGED